MQRLGRRAGHAAGPLQSLSRSGSGQDAAGLLHGRTHVPAVPRDREDDHEAVHVVPQRYFYRHPPTRDGIRTLFETLDPDFHDVYSMHLWAHLWWDAWRTDFTSFHAGLVTDEQIRTVDTTYNVIARGFLD